LDTSILTNKDTVDVGWTLEVPAEGVNGKTRAQSVAGAADRDFFFRPEAGLSNFRKAGPF